MKIEQISSRTNDYIIKCNSFHDRKKRQEAGVFIFEGVKLFKEAISREVEFESVIFTPGNRMLCEENLRNYNGSFRFIEVTESVYQKLSSEKSPSGIFCVAKAIDKIHKTATIYRREKFSDRKTGAIIMLSGLQDPGNLGTVIRTASAFAFDEIIIDSGSVDIYNEKTVRASMGTLFSQKITRVDDCKQAVSELRQSGYTVYGAALTENSLQLNKINCNKSTCFVIGNEGHGLDASLLECCDGSVIIPMPGGAESLNASIAASLLMWECIKNDC